MRHFTAFIGFFVFVSLCNAGIVQRRTYRDTEEILVPVAIIQDGEEVKEPSELKENVKETEIENVEPTVISAEDIAAAVDEEQKLETIAGTVQADRRIDGAIVEEEIKEEEQNKEIIEALENANENENKLSESEVAQFEHIEVIKEPAKEEIEQSEKLMASESQTGSESEINAAQQSEASIRQATQATPAQTTAQPNIIQQFIQNSPLGQLPSFPSLPQLPQLPQLPTLPTFDPAAAFQSFQQFTSNLAGPFQNLGGQQQDPAVNAGAGAAAAVTTARPAQGPIQQFLSSFTQAPTQSAPAQPGPIQSFLNFFQGNRPQGGAAAAAPAAASPQAQSSIEPEVVAQTSAEIEGTAAAASAETNEQVSNALRDSGEAVDSFEATVQPNELIVVNDDATETDDVPTPISGYASN